MHVAIIGAGPAGAHLACLLSQGGCAVLLFDAREKPWEKPCGGGVTTKALREYRFLHQHSARQMVTSVRVISAQNRTVNLTPNAPFAIYSRQELDRLMRQRAIEAGAQMICARIARIARKGNQWSLISQAGEIYQADFLVGADGATSKIRKYLGIEFQPQDFAYGLGWHVQKNPPDYCRAPEATRVDIKYLREKGTGYLWAFPRTDHLSYGIAAKYQEKTPAQLKAELLAFIASQDEQTANEIRANGHPSDSRIQFYAAMLPALQLPAWNRLRVSNADQQWALIGDAAGFVDPITGEGIHYALRSAELLAQSMLTRTHSYETLWRDDFGGEMTRAAQLYDRFYHSTYLGAPFTERLVQLAKYHRGIRETLNDLIAGEQGYVDLKPQLKNRLWRVF
jgi:geranylgeranyl reductase family protein